MVRTMKKLSCDIETFSDVDLIRCGVYKYADSPNFEMLLFAYAVDDGDVHIIDIAGGEELPEKIIQAIKSDTVVKTAYNAQFERVCLSRYLKLPEGEYLNPQSWYCTAVQAAELALPLSLADVGSVLGLERQKMTEGKELIKYFCVPCKPTKSNGNRTRNRPCHDINKWETFKKYCMRDVDVERQIADKLKMYPIRDEEHRLYVLDQIINDRGVLVDSELAEQAVKLNSIQTTVAVEQAYMITGLENPNSVTQLKQWLKENGVEIESLSKKAVKSLADETDGDVSEMLKLRLLMAKTSVKKYEAVIRSVCSDNRVHGMMRFCGANRTGRWSGNILQPQNLPQNHLPDLTLARDIVKDGDFEMLDMMFGNVPNVLSELIRTILIPKPNHRFIVADFSAIEARVLAWIAGEQWRIDTFKNGGDIYCASASKMFKVPVEKHGVNGELRQKGKISELACIAEGQLVLTDAGLIPIEKITLEHKLWDGEEWVSHDGVIYKGEQEVITYDGLTATKEHLVWVKGEQKPIQFGVAASCGAYIIQTGNDRSAIRLGESNLSRKKMECVMEPLFIGCGAIQWQLLSNLQRGKSKGCQSCSQPRQIPLWLEKRLTAAKQRCENPQDKGYHNYGARGIKFEFSSVTEAGLYLIKKYGLPKRELKIDRIDNNGSYARDNIRFVTHTENNSNKRCTVLSRFSQKYWPYVRSVVIRKLSDGLSRKEIIQDAETAVFEKRKNWRLIQARLEFMTYEMPEDIIVLPYRENSSTTAVTAAQSVR